MGGEVGVGHFNAKSHFLFDLVICLGHLPWTFASCIVSLAALD